MKNCPVCKSDKTLGIFKYNNLPLFNLNYYNTRKDALSAPGENVNFLKCKNCEFLFNSSYSQLDYKFEYESSRAFSKVFNKYIYRVGETLITSLKHNVKKIVEVGAGDCHFAEVIMNLKPDLEYHAFDPSWEKSEFEGNLYKYNEYYQLKDIKPSLVVVRHTLEHIMDVNKFIESVTNELPINVFIETPCSSFVLRNNFHYFSYEHCSYFDQNSLMTLMCEFGYSPDFMNYVFNGENIISLWSRVQHAGPTKVKSQNNELNKEFHEWKSTLVSKFQNGDVVWGAAGKGVMTLNILEQDYNKIPFVVDKNPNIQGKFIPITGNKIISPNDLKKIQVENIYVLNSLYLDEIISECRELDVHANISPLFD